SLVMPRGISTGRLLPSMRRLAWRVGRVYAWATALFAAGFAGLGLSVFDAVNLSMVTLATGGCYDAAPLGGTRGVLLSFALMAAMLFASGNFFFYAETLRRRSFFESSGANEMKAVLRLVAAAGLIVSLHLWQNGVYGFWESLRQGFFAVTAFLSTTGTSPEMFSGWPDFDRFLLLLLAFVGGSIASSSGGLKILRVMVLLKAAREELVRTLHPRMVLRVEVLQRVVPIPMVGYLLAFFALYIGSFFVGALLLSAMGIELLSSMGLSMACLTSAGPVALLVGDAGLYTAIGESGRLVCSALMLLGRLEIFSFLFVLQTFWGRWKGRW
ncbi:MAG: TrkH family potassium uptake protein, partial [Schwartzia sp.]|nr:TrkH family potassium uptake protein [Schwartzia sp. (in: firmicutes)]